jgi:hypothetical protein
MGKIRLQSGKLYMPKPSDEVACEQHGTTTTYGQLDWIGVLALESGLDTDSECLLSPKRKGRK